MQNPQLDRVRRRQEIQASVSAFNRDAHLYPELARSLLRTTTYWVFDPQTETFGPSKFVGFQAMDFNAYASARQGLEEGDRFDGHVTHSAIEQILGTYTPNPRLSTALRRWGESLLGPDIFDEIDETKWRFVSL